MLYSTRDLMSQVRSQISEQNDSRVSNTQILNSLNRGYDNAFDIMAQLYPEPIISFFEVNPDSEGKITIPDGVFEDRILLVEYYLQNSTNGYRTKISETDNLNDLGVVNNVTGSYPYVYSIIGRDIQLAPARGMERFLMRIWFVDSPLPLVMDQGFIETIDRDNNFIVVDELRNTDDGLVALNPSDSYGKYVNFVDRETGVYKATMQIESISGNKITFKSTPTRSSVFNLAVVGVIPDGVKLDDGISSVYGSSIVYFKRPVTNYLIQYAVNEIQRSLGVSNLSFEEGALSKLEKKIRDVWKRRPASKFKRSYGRVWRSRNFRNWSS